MSDRAIAIIGMAFRFPGADTPERFWQDIRDGVTHVRRFTEDELAAAGIPPEEYRAPDFAGASGLLDGIDLFDADFFGMSNREAAVTDPQQRLFLECCYHALEDAGYPTQSEGNRIGVYASAGYGTYAMHTYLANNLDPAEWAGDWAATQQVQLGTRADFTATRAAFRLGLTGPAVNVATACSSSLVAVHLAAQALLFGDADIAVAGSAALHLPQVTGQRHVKGSIISRRGSVRAFDADADGTVGGNGVAAVVLKRLDRARADGDTIHAVVLGSGLTNDGADKRTFAAPTVTGQRDAVLSAIAAAAVPVESIGYVEAHGTGTFKGDPIEFEALTAAFRRHTERVGFCSLGSAKPALGHLDTCAGMAGLIKAVLVLRHGVIPPLANFRTPNPALALAESPFTIATEAADWRPEGPRRASVNSVGMGGTNAHVIVEQAPVSRDSSLGLPAPSLLPLSARDPLALRQLATAFRDHLLAHPDLDLADVVTTAMVGRRHFAHRLVALGSTALALAESLDRAPIDHQAGSPVTFVLADQEGLRSGAALALHGRFAEVRDVLTECDGLYRETVGCGQLMGPLLDRTDLTVLPANLVSPALFALQVAQARLWRSLGVSPASVVGHGAGEYAAMHVTGAVTLAEGMRLAIQHKDSPRSTVVGDHTPLRIGPRDAGLDALWADVARLYRGGVDINWNVLLEGCGGGRIPLPGYPFQRTTHWIGPPARRDLKEAGMPEQAVLDRVVDLTAHHLGYRPDEVDADRAFVDLGADSLTLVSMLRDLETEFEVEISMRDLLDDATTPRLVGQLIADLRGARPAETRPEPVVDPPPPMAGPPLVAGKGNLVVPESATLRPGTRHTPVAHAEDLARRLVARTRGSKEIAQRYRRVLADSRAVVGFRRATKEMLYPISAREARGSTLEDVDGNRYVDITMGFGALLFGHEPEFVTEAVRDHLAHGLRLGPRGVDTGEAAVLLGEMTGMERVAFANSGTEANSGAIRLARAATGRDRIVMFRGAYHGHIDSVLGRSSGDRTVPVSAGIPDSAVAEVIVLEYGSDHSLQVIDELADTIAAVLVEPVQSRNPSLRPVEFVRSLRELTSRRGIVLLFDEMLTGLRAHQRGAQHYYGVTPDLVTYGKALGGGFPIGAIAGRADIMDGIDGGFWQYGDDSVPPRETTFYGGTYIQHPVSMAAARAVLTHLRQEGTGLQERLNASTDRMADHLNTFFQDEEYPLRLDHFGSMFRFTHRADMELLYHHLMLRGVYVWEWRSCYLSTAHTDADVDYVIDAVSDSLRELRGAGYFPATRPKAKQAPDFSLYFFGDSAEVERSEGDKYQQILDSARFADERGFHGVWLPERHFNTFGGLFPNPAVLAATLAGQTNRIRLNAGSVVLPLHDPIRIAEEWSMVDNLSGGRVGLGFGTGWHADDFVLHPDRFDRRKDISFENLADVRRLWRGETVRRRSGSGRDVDVRVHPRPVQDRPPMFLATTGRPESYEQAAKHDLGIVTNLMSQTIEELAENIKRYRQARVHNGLDPAAGRVVVLVHTYLADDHAKARADALEPMVGYMRSSMMLRSAAVAVGNAADDLAAARPEDLEVLLRRGYDRYCDQRALIGSPDSCVAVVDALRDAGVDEIGALVDFGMPAAQVSAGLDRLDRLRRRYHSPEPEPVSGPATAGQRRIWLACQLIGTSAYNEAQAVRLRGRLDQDALWTALRGLVDRHPGLRTVFRPGDRDQALRQVVLDRVDVPMTVTEGDGPRDVMRQESARAYDLATGPLFAPRLVCLAADDHLLVLGMHHIVVDGHSGEIIATDLQELYRAAVEHREPVFDEPAGSPLDAPQPLYTPADQAWWRDHLSGEPPVLHLPTDRPRTRTFAANGASVATSLDAEQTAALRKWSSAQGATLFATLFTAWQVVLRRFSGQDEFVVGTTFGQRPPETRNTVGFFVSLLPLRCRLTDDMELRTVVRSTRDTVLGAGEHTAVDLDALYADINPDPGSARPLTPVSVDLDTDSLASMTLPGVLVEPVADGTDSSPLEASLMATQTPTGLRLRIRYDADLFDEPTMRRYLAQLVLVLDAMAAGATTTVGDLPMLTADDEAKLSAFGDGGPQSTAEPTLTVHPAGVVIDGDASYSGDQLAAAAASVTTRLTELGVRRGDLVAIALPRGFGYVAAMTGVVAAGAAYVPLDPVQPGPRIAAILADAAPVAVVCDPDFATELARVNVNIRHSDKALPPATMAAGDLMCLIYTSGSTGVPKGVALEHGSVAAIVAHYRDRLAITANDRISWYSSIGFDGTQIEVWPALTTGAPLHVVPDDVRLDPAEVVKWLVRQRITVALLPTAIAESVLEQPWPADTALRVLVTGGERLTSRPRPDLPFMLYNVYGPTECSVFCTWAAVVPHEPGVPSIGTPTPGMRLEIKDQAGRLLPPGAVGELHVGGPQVARGYHGDPNTDRFTTDTKGRRWYRTGDLVRWRTDGQLAFVGRTDDQVKVRGVRVEAAEVARAVRTLPGVRDATVVASTDQITGHGVLTCYVQTHHPVNGDLAERTREWRTRLAELLPRPMIPQHWHAVNELSLTVNGKRGAPGAAAVREEWAAVLGTDVFGDDADFFDLGGHSISAVVLLNRIRDRFGVDYPIAEFFDNRTVRAMVTRLSGNGVR
ncbi:non-ribosomal peptide synthetase/type I polyketide synthase [Actinocrispum wychmicini]|uniref:Acyl carrier protein n=1 Tax=Actinocrispum wychmicini TaxID=1213861 RepID=A0A4R2JKY6_9PSEU|nr:non-ribosomal peptide synthetase/type I polyketide synthase [Actinocrispum wychmicini]TCO60671.1 acyl carrier protein [Actinocrispum wychmicini]